MKTEQKITKIYNLWLNGNSKDAAKSIRNLSKKELFILCTNSYYCDNINNRYTFVYHFVNKVLFNPDFLK